MAQGPGVRRGGGKAAQQQQQRAGPSPWDLVPRRRDSGGGPARGVMGSIMGLDSRVALALAGGGGFLLGLLLQRWLGNGGGPAPEGRPAQPKAGPTRGPTSGGAQGGKLPLEQMAQHGTDYKMVLVVRNDLKMGKGKIGAQCGHATLGLYKQLQHRAPRSLERWEDCGQVKVTLKVETEREMLALQEKARKENIPSHITIDAGRTQIAPNSKTVMALLGPEQAIQRVTGHLKLL